MYTNDSPEHIVAFTVAVEFKSKLIVVVTIESHPAAETKVSEPERLVALYTTPLYTRESFSQIGAL